MEKAKAPRVVAPRPAKLVPRAGTDVAKRGLGWRNANAAAQKFLIAANSAHDSLVGFPIAKKYVDWLRGDAMPCVTEYIDQLNKCDSDFSEINLLSCFQSVEGGSIIDLLSIIKEVCSDVSADLECDAPGVPEQIRNDIADFIDEKLDPVKEAGWRMYYVFIQAV